MNEKLVPILALRLILLEKLKPQFVKENYKMILGSSLAAQDYILSGHYHEYDQRMGKLFKKLPEYIKVHQKYKLPYNPTQINQKNQIINPGLVMDLAWSFRTDIINGLVDSAGNIQDVTKIPSSEVLKVYHNSSEYGVPSDALYVLPPSQLRQIINQVRQKTK